MLLLSMIIFNKCVFMTLISVLPYEQLDLLIQQYPNQKYVCCGLQGKARVPKTKEQLSKCQILNNIYKLSLYILFRKFKTATVITMN